MYAPGMCTKCTLFYDFIFQIISNEQITTTEGWEGGGVEGMGWRGRGKKRVCLN